MILFPRYPLAEGLSVSRIATGLWQVADQQRKDPDFDVDQAALAMSPYVDAGLTTFDLSPSEGASEDIAGIFGDRAERLIRWAPKPGAITREFTREAVHHSLRRLHTERIDLLQLHAWNFANPSWLDGLFALQEMKREGLIRHIGVANFDTAHLRMAVQTGIEIVSNQVSFSVVDTRARGAMTEFCVAHKIRLLAYGTLLGGFLTDRWLGKEEPDWDGLETWSLLKYGRFIRAAGGWKAFQQVLRRLDEIATRHGVPLAAVAARLILEHETVASIVLGARLSRSEHIEDSLKILGLTLDREDHETLEEGLKYLKPIPGDCGDEYRKAPFLTESGRKAPAGLALDDDVPPFSVKPGSRGRTLIPGSPDQKSAGTVAAHRLEDRVWVSGTMATFGGRLIGGNDARSQFHFIVDKIEGVLISLGGNLSDVVITRVYVRNLYDEDDVRQAHAERFRHAQPASTFVGSDLQGEEALVIVEAEAIVNG